MSITSRFVSGYLALREHRGKYRVAKHLFRLAHGQPILTPYGVYMRCDKHDQTNFFALSGKPNVDYRDVYDEVVKIKPGSAFVDIGANAGIFSMVAGKVLDSSGPVIAFEPSLANFGRLLDNARLNGLTEFYPFRMAIGDCSERMRLTEDPTHSGTSHLTSDGGVPILKAAYADLRAVIEPLLEKRDIVIKIDVEGAEAMVAQSIASLLARPGLKKAIVEVDREHLKRFGSTPEQLYRLFGEAGLAPRRGLAIGGHFNEVFERPE
jgi:FkbM family methyltransferase